MVVSSRVVGICSGLLAVAFFTSMMVIDWTPRYSFGTTSARIVGRRIAPSPPFWPLYKQADDGGCGNWQQSYKKMQEDMLSGKRSKRVVVSVAIKTGLADRLVGTISAFFYALLTDRAFQLQSYGDLPSFGLAFDPAEIDWRRPPDNDALLWPVQHDSDDEVSKRKYGEGQSASIDNQTHAFIHHWRNSAYYVADEMYGKLDFRTQPPENPGADTVLFVSNRGRSVRLFENPHHKDQLHQWGLTPETAMSCAFQFLFTPKEGTIRHVERELDALNAQPEALKIGIHIRLGDSEFHGGSSPRLALARAQAFFDCAHQIEDTQPLDNQRNVIWYMISDSDVLRKAAALRYGSQRLITDTLGTAQHVSCSEFEGCRGNETSAIEALQLAAGQLLSLTHTDLQVVPKYSGFGKAGAWMASREKHIYTLGQHDSQDLGGYQFTNRVCDFQQPDPLGDIVYDWSGI